MSDHLTIVIEKDGLVTAQCPEHEAVGLCFSAHRTGWNAASLEARAHDHMAHGIYRDEALYECAIRRVEAPHE